MNMLPAAAAALLVAAAPAAAQPPPDYGFEWRTIGAPGNAPASPAEFPLLDLLNLGPIGRVDYEYRLSRTEVTTSQWHEFVQTYASFHENAIADGPLLTGRWILPGNNPGEWVYPPIAQNAAGSCGWLYAARYCNWLHNGKANAAWAFDSGAYDMSSYVRQSDGSWIGQVTRSPGARFWIPTIDEWTKGMHYDPNKFGIGQGGYWRYPHGKDVPPVGGPPGSPGAETGAGSYDSGDNPFRIYPVGSYPNAQSPWGLLDGSGGESEWVESIYGSVTTRAYRGSVNRQTNAGSAAFDDQLDWFYYAPIDALDIGLRLASVVPSPSTLVLPMLGTSLALRRRRLSC